MAMPIHKFELEVPGKTVLPKGELLDIQLQGRDLVAWVRRNPYRAPFVIRAAFTGEDVGPWWTYMKTLQSDGLVLHLFSKTPV